MDEFTTEWNKIATSRPSKTTISRQSKITTSRPSKTTISRPSKTTISTPNKSRTTIYNTFINVTIKNDVESFSLNGTEFLFVNRAVPYRLAIIVCRDLDAQLANLPQKDVAEYVAEALSECNHEFDTLWVAGELHGHNISTGTWKWHVWQEHREYENISKSLLDIRVPEKALGVEDVDELRKCMGFGRNYHLEPELRPLSCTARRHVICQRPRGSATGNSTHMGWIRIGPRLYKIFYEKTNYRDAETYCALSTKKGDAKLAVIVSRYDAQVLGRYMLIGRPSLEMAWIGADWFGDAYVFRAESLVLKNRTSLAGYPPWAKGEMRKSKGCLLLDRHLHNTSFFVESKCTTPRARICYKIVEGEKHETMDVIFKKWSYRLVGELMTWQESVDYCDRYKFYNGRLVEITEARQHLQMLYVMGENRTAIDHVWLGGKYTKNRWMWNHAKIEVAKNLLSQWVNNQTYWETVDEDYICLNMDRENHVKSLFYGTECDYEQYFVCLFPTQDFLKLQQYEESLMENSTSEIVLDPDENRNSVLASDKDDF